MDPSLTTQVNPRDLTQSPHNLLVSLGAGHHQWREVVDVLAVHVDVWLLQEELQQVLVVVPGSVVKS